MKIDISFANANEERLFKKEILPRLLDSDQNPAIRWSELVEFAAIDHSTATLGKTVCDILGRHLSKAVV